MCPFLCPSSVHCIRAEPPVLTLSLIPTLYLCLSIFISLFLYRSLPHPSPHQTHARTPSLYHSITILGWTPCAPQSEKLASTSVLPTLPWLHTWPSGPLPAEHRGTPRGPAPAGPPRAAATWHGGGWSYQSGHSRPGALMGFRCFMWHWRGTRGPARGEPSQERST